MDVWNIYILKLTNEKYYVGKTKKPSTRLNEHFNGIGSAWTKKYPPIELVEFVENCSSFDEDKYTLQYMNAYGIENVRGGSYTQIQLDEFTLNHIQKQLVSANDLCFKCGKSDHFAKDCPLYVKSTCEKCFNCGEFGHMARECTINIICHKCHQVGHKSTECTNNDMCYRCGRNGHKSYDCYSTTHANGNKL
jgi:cellular nucleic acid-binding protein